MLQAAFQGFNCLSALLWHVITRARAARQSHSEGHSGATRMTTDAERQAQKAYWKEHSENATVEAMMLDSKAADIDKLERPEVGCVEPRSTDRKRSRPPWPHRNPHVARIAAPSPQLAAYGLGRRFSSCLAPWMACGWWSWAPVLAGATCRVCTPAGNRAVAAAAAAYSPAAVLLPRCRFTGPLASKAKSVVALDFMENLIEQNRASNGHLGNVDFRCGRLAPSPHPRG